MDSAFYGPPLPRDVKREQNSRLIAKRLQNARVLAERVLTFDVDWRHAHGADFETITLNTEQWAALVAMAMRASS